MVVVIILFFSLWKGVKTLGKVILLFLFQLGGWPQKEIFFLVITRWLVKKNGPISTREPGFEPQLHPCFLGELGQFPSLP